MIDIFGDESEIKPIVRYGVSLPGYYATKSGKIYSAKTNKFISLFKGKDGYLRCSLSLPVGTFDDHSYYKSNFKRASFNLQQDVHRLIAETFIPIDDNPPIPIEDWNKTPETAKQFIRESANIDHIIPDLSNNSVSNLRWVTPKQNNSHRKKQVECEFK